MRGAPNWAKWSEKAGLVSFSLPNPSSMESITCCLYPIERPSSKLLKEHISFDHLDWQPYKCAYCSKTRASKAQLLEHCFAVHQIKDPEIGNE
ncbi:hypothetical protein WR25_00786 [Diploscapter pachys]|uniref:C2H2-type domain-containing protein n=1 Tax=Diploscapter pachys TaxID=2018661 RepID=A0A2A2KHT5_9BILA|nr:hypothetical protein WR25_00786 [Diploscapter pachys]